MTRATPAFALASLLAVSTAHAAAPVAAQRLAQDAIITDTHIDAPTELLKHWDDLALPTPAKDFDWPRARQGGLDVAFMVELLRTCARRARRGWSGTAR